MRTDAVIRSDGFRALLEKLGPVEAERFLVLVERGSGDYTEWRKTLWADQTVDEIHERAAAHWERERTDADG
jgi:hypothetical protein